MTPASSAIWPCGSGSAAEAGRVLCPRGYDTWQPAESTDGTGPRGVVVGGIYTRTGDDGTTSLPGGARVPKTDPLIEAFGALDEANSHIGLARLDVADSELDRVLGFVQQRLFNCAAALGGATVGVDPEDVMALERSIDRFAECGRAVEQPLLDEAEDAIEFAVGDVETSESDVAVRLVERAERLDQRVALGDPSAARQ
jgi:ATP:cob(I)alamin adenosyltransferase